MSHTASSRRPARASALRPPSRLPGRALRLCPYRGYHDRSTRANGCGRPRARSSRSCAAGCISWPFPLSLAAGIVLVVLAPTTTTRVAAAVFAVTSTMLFGSSALFHRGHWGPRWHGVLRRLDHSKIFLLIAGTYTPFAHHAARRHATRKILLGLVWGGALLGIAFRIFWIGAPRWLYLPVYIALGWAAVFWLGDFADDRRAGGADADHRRRRAVLPRRRRSTASSGPTRYRAGSASTRSSTAS